MFEWLCISWCKNFGLAVMNWMILVGLEMFLFDLMVKDFVCWEYWVGELGVWILFIGSLWFDKIGDVMVLFGYDEGVWWV